MSSFLASDGLAFLIQIWAAAKLLAAEPTLAPLSFWGPPERMAEIEIAYRDRVLPILNRHGLAESKERGRATVDSVFS